VERIGLAKRIFRPRRKGRPVPEIAHFSGENSVAVDAFHPLPFVCRFCAILRLTHHRLWLTNRAP